MTHTKTLHLFALVAVLAGGVSGAAQDAPPAGKVVETSNASPKVAPNGPSAQLGLAATFEVIQDSLPDAKLEFNAVDFQSVAATETAEAHVLVNLDLRAFGDSSASAKASFEALNAALKARAKNTKAPGFEYKRSTSALRSSLRPAGDATEKPLSHSHEGRIEIALPKDVLHRMKARQAVPEDAPAIAPENMTMFVRALAARDQVKLGAIKLSQLKREKENDLDRWMIQPQGTKEKPASVKAAQLANMLFFLEKDTAMINVARVRFSGSDVDALKEVSILIEERRR